MPKDYYYRPILYDLIRNAGNDIRSNKNGKEVEAQLLATIGNIINGKPEDAIKLLVTDKNFANFTVLHVAAQEQFLSVCRLLVELGANPEEIDKDGYTAEKYYIAPKGPKYIKEVVREIRNEKSASFKKAISQNPETLLQTTSPLSTTESARSLSGTGSTSLSGTSTGVPSLIKSTYSPSSTSSPPRSARSSNSSQVSTKSPRSIGDLSTREQKAETSHVKRIRTPELWQEDEKKNKKPRTTDSNSSPAK